MKTCRTIAELFRKLREKAPGASIGFVPTMGYLHEGHASLVRTSRAENDCTVVSIFVNPAQFGPGEDFQRYPRNTARDLQVLEDEGVDLLFLPEPGEIYPEGYDTYVEVENLSRPLCGISRPGHFRGVATVVLKLFNLVRPNRAYFGQKDAQQAVIIKRMIQDLNLNVNLRVLPIIRDRDGLALSSRNIYLTPEQRKKALKMPLALQRAQEAIRNGATDAGFIRSLILENIGGDPNIEIEYVETVSLDRLMPLEKIDTDNTLVACAIRIGKTRLIDNFILGSV